MRFCIERAIFERFPGLSIGVVVARDLDNTGSAGAIQAQLREQEQRIRAFSIETLAQQPQIAAWRSAYAAFGARPKEHRSSVESLYRLVLREPIRHINPLVDAYNLISLKHVLPVGGEDIDKMQGDLLLAFASANEPPVLLLGDKEPRPPHEGEVIYKDGEGAVCRRWNWREAERTKLTEATRNCILVIEGLPPVGRSQVEAAVRELAELVQEQCKARVTSALLDSGAPELEL